MIVEPLAGALGAEVRDVNLNTLDQGGWREMRDAFLKYSVLAIRDQKIEPRT